MDTLKQVLRVALAFVGAVVGAGFISGQELGQFFLQFSVWGIVGWSVIVATLVLGGGYAIRLLSERKYSDLSALMVELFGERIGKAANLITVGYLIGGLIIMISGAGTIVANLLGFDLWVGILLVVATMYLVVIGKSKRLVGVSAYLIPALILVTIYAVAKVFYHHGVPQVTLLDISIANPSVLLPHWMIAVPLYLGYNILGAAVNFINIAKEASPKTGNWGGLLGGLLVSLLGSLLMLGMWETYPLWSTFDLPMIAIVEAEAPELYLLFSLSMVVAMFTVANGYSLGLASYLDQRVKVDFKWLSLFVLAGSGVASLLGFSTLLGVIYPIFGILAVLLFVVAVIRIVPWEKLATRKTKTIQEETGSSD